MEQVMQGSSLSTNKREKRGTVQFWLHTSCILLLIDDSKITVTLGQIMLNEQEPTQIILQFWRKLQKMAVSVNSMKNSSFYSFAWNYQKKND